MHPNQVSDWKQELLKGGASLFANKSARQQREQEALQAELYEQIGRLQMELEWLKKKLPGTVEAKRAMIERDYPEISVRRQCELIGLNRSSLYYEPAGESAYNLLLMRLIDAQYIKTPSYGWPRMTAYLRRKEHLVNHKRVQRLMRLMGIQAIYASSETALGGWRFAQVRASRRVRRPAGRHREPHVCVHVQLRQRGAVLVNIDNLLSMSIRQAPKSLASYEPDRERRGLLLSLVALLAGRYFDKATIQNLFRQEVEMIRTNTFIDSWLEEAEQRGTVRGHEEGREEGELITQRRLLLRLLEHRFGPLPVQLVLRTEDLTIDDLNRLFDLALDAPSLEEVTQALDAIPPLAR